MPRSARSGAAWAAVGVFAAALFFAFFVADATHPAAIFPKYLEAAAAPPAEQSERLLDYSPLYLALTRALAPLGYRAILVFQCLLHGVTAAAVALAVALLADAAGWGWGLAAGLGVASYRPFLVYCGTHEPEGLVLALLAVAVLLGLAARLEGGPEGRWRFLAAAGAAACLAAAGLGRPQHLLLVPIWAAWLAAGRLPRERLRMAGVVLLIPALLVVPLLISRALATGVPTIMDPGAVFYEGNAPGAIGLIRFAPPAVFTLESANGKAYDYGHVAYRRIAAAGIGGINIGAMSRSVPSSVSNRYWTGLGFESLRAWPGRALARFVRKAALALSPYEGQDLESAEKLDRHLRPRLPWGFFLPLISLPWIALASPERRRQLAGPLCIAALAFAVQTALYASARQRLPLALALWIVGPVLAADLLRGRLTAAVRPGLAVLLGVAVALGLSAATARYALLDQLGWDAALGPEPPSLGGRLVALGQGRAFRPELLASARRFAAGVDLAERGHPTESLQTLAPLLGTGGDWTIDEKEVGVPEYWAARDLLALGDRGRAALAAKAAQAIRPDDPRVAALALRLERPKGAPEPAAWRPPGTDPVSATLARAQAAVADGDQAGALALLRPLAGAFPELAVHPP
ncbi:MAG: hypothetical protein QOJ16_3131 [Acidobacteriota bacterium]|jgi:hypothetical protein|nr:hypothetical protein [Acidobacteriota bacterium]